MLSSLLENNLYWWMFYLVKAFFCCVFPNRFDVFILLCRAEVELFHVVTLFWKMLCKNLVWWLIISAHPDVCCSPNNRLPPPAPLHVCVRGFVCASVWVLIMQLLSATVRPAETPMCSLLIAAHAEVSSSLGVLNRELIDLSLENKSWRSLPGKNDNSVEQ